MTVTAGRAIAVWGALPLAACAMQDVPGPQGPPPPPPPPPAYAQPMPVGPRPPPPPVLPSPTIAPGPAPATPCLSLGAATAAASATPHGFLTVHSRPPGAMVIWRDRVIGGTPLESKEVEAGTAQLVLVFPRLEPVFDVVTVEPSAKVIVDRAFPAPPSTPSTCS